MIESMITEMESAFRKGVFSEKTSFRFRLDKAVFTITLDGDAYEVEKDGADKPVDCDCRTSAEMFRKIWYDGYRPGFMEFISGAIVCDNPLLLPKFLRAFGR